MFQCPSAEKMTLANRFDFMSLEVLAKGNYAANFGSDSYVSWQEPATAGAFGVNTLRGIGKVTQSEGHPSILGAWKMGLGQGTRFGDIIDGTSNTLAVSEVLPFDHPDDGRGVWVWAGMGGTSFTARTTPNSPDPDNLPACYGRIPEGDPRPCVLVPQQATRPVWAAPRSAHSGGVNAALADGSVRFINNGVDIVVWRGMATRENADVATLP
jgi:prepilin-type processing-associated H-X9-DG protein